MMVRDQDRAVSLTHDLLGARAKRQTLDTGAPVTAHDDDIERFGCAHFPLRDRLVLRRSAVHVNSVFDQSRLGRGRHAHLQTIKLGTKRNLTTQAAVALLYIRRHVERCELDFVGWAYDFLPFCIDIHMAGRT